MLIGGNKAVEVVLDVQFPRRPVRGQYTIHADQFYRGRWLGRVNYLLRGGEEEEVS